jgi:ribosome-associated protein
MARNLQEKVKAQGGRVYGIEGEKTGDWILVDLGSIVVHVMQPTIRTHYNLEELWTPPKVARKRAAKSVSTADEA